MALTLKDAAKLAKEIASREKARQEQDALEHSTKAISLSRINDLEIEIDTNIPQVYKERRLWYITAKIGIAEFFLSRSSWETIWELRRKKLWNQFLYRYTVLGWIISDTFYMEVRRLRFVKKIGNTEVVPEPPSSKLLEEKKRIRAELLAKLSEIECEIQFLTESPNSRNPQLLLQTANK